MNRQERKLASCGGCEARWGGRRTCHCATCHRTFTGLTAFDHHGPGRCGHLEGDPPGLAVIRVSGNQQVWGLPDTGGRWGGEPAVTRQRAPLVPDAQDLLVKVIEMQRRTGTEVAS